VCVVLHREFSLNCQRLSHLTPDCWMDLIHTSIHTPLIEFENHLYNSLMNLGRNPHETTQLMVLEGMSGANSHVFAEFSDTIAISRHLQGLGLDFAKIAASSD
jgi:hypothetical protein